MTEGSLKNAGEPSQSVRILKTTHNCPRNLDVQNSEDNRVQYLQFYWKHNKNNASLLWVFNEYALLWQSKTLYPAAYCTNLSEVTAPV